MMAEARTRSGSASSAIAARELPPLRRNLVEMSLNPDQAFNTCAALLDPLRLAAAQELFTERREQIPLLARRAADAGITQLRSFADIVPLLFSHTVYKSYPPAFFGQGHWDAMLKWLQTLSVADLSNVDVAGGTDVDHWLER